MTPRTRRGFLRDSALLAGSLALPLQPTRRAWLHPVRLDAADFADLQFLRPLLSKARIVQLGENGHGAGESMRLRARIARYLYEELGFTILAFESSLFLCHLADTRAHEAAAQRTLTSSLVGVWHTHEMLPLFEAIRAARATPRPLHLAGFDVQPIGANRRLRPSFFGDLLKNVDANLARAAVATDTEFLGAYDRGSTARRDFLRANAARLAAEYEHVANGLDAQMAALQIIAGRVPPLVARQEARSMAAYVRYQAAPDMRRYAEIRDEAMFENLKFLAEQLYPASKIVVWGHNYHLRHNNAAVPPSTPIFPGVTAHSMGWWTRQHFGAQVYTVAQYERSGVVVDNSRQPYDVTQPADATLEHRLAKLSTTPVFVDIAAAAKTDDGRWLKEPTTARFNAQHPETIVPAAQYDALLMLPTVSAPRFLT